jgi:hypothetical protein
VARIIRNHARSNMQKRLKERGRKGDFKKSRDGKFQK